MFLLLPLAGSRLICLRNAEIHRGELGRLRPEFNPEDARPSFRRRRLFRLVALLAAVLILVTCTAYVFRSRILAGAAAMLVEDDGPQKADCILVLGGDYYGYRITKGAELVQAGYAPYVLVDGPKALMGYESDTEIAYAVQNGFSKSMFRSVPLPAGMNSTSAEVEYVANNILRPQHIRKILLVTSNYHTRRAAHFMRRTAPWLKVAVVPAPDPYFSVHGWWKSREGKKTFLYEWMKTISEWWGD